MFYEIFTNLCHENKISPTALLVKLNISTSKLTAWRNGSMPSVAVLILISEFFDVSIDYLVTGNDRQEKQETENEKTMMTLFKKLSEKEQNRIIGRLELMVEQSESSTD